MHYECVRDVAKTSDLVDVLQSVAFPDWPSIALLRCRYHVVTCDDQKFERLAVACPQEFLRATVKRKAEFISGRYWVRWLLEANDQVPDVPIGSHRQPLWPSGWVGSQCAAIESIAGKIGCSAQPLCNWVRQVERDAGERSGLSTDEHAQLKGLLRENRELRQANEILRKASAYFAQAELDRRFKP